MVYCNNLLQQCGAIIDSHGWNRLLQLTFARIWYSRWLTQLHQSIARTIVDWIVSCNSLVVAIVRCNSTIVDSRSCTSLLQQFGATIVQVLTSRNTHINAPFPHTHTETVCCLSLAPSLNQHSCNRLLQQTVATVQYTAATVQKDFALLQQFLVLCSSLLQEFGANCWLYQMHQTVAGIWRQSLTLSAVVCGRNLAAIVYSIKCNRLLQQCNRLIQQSLLQEFGANRCLYLQCPSPHTTRTDANTHIIGLPPTLTYIHTHTSSLLLEFGAIVDHKNLEGLTPSQIADK